MAREVVQAIRVRWRRNAGGVAMSVALHALVLTALLLALRQPPAPPELPAVVVQIVPLEPSPPARTAPRKPPGAAGAAADKTPPPAIPAPATVPSAPDSAGADQAGMAGVRGVLRGVVGCSHAEFLKLTSAERDGCARRLARSADPDLVLPAPIAPEKRAWFEASLAARHSPGRPAGVGCAVFFGHDKLALPRSPPHALKLGPLPCYVFPGQGALTEEADIDPPAPGMPLEAPVIPRHHDLDRMWGPAGPPHGEAPAPRLDLIAPAPDPPDPHLEGAQR